jgi:DNA-binding GntR family transcriptional regulator
MALERVSTVDALATELRREILDGERPGGTRLVERELTEHFRVARHTLRAALRDLAGEGLVRIEPHRGAVVARLDPEDVRGLYELRAALELEAAHLALERGGGRLPDTVHAALARLQAACTGSSWTAVTEAHGALHSAIVVAADSPRIAAAHAALQGEMDLFLLQYRPLSTPEELARDHEALVAALEQEGPAALRRHLHAAADAVGRNELR